MGFLNNLLNFVFGSYYVFGSAIFVFIVLALWFYRIKSTVLFMIFSFLSIYLMFYIPVIFIVCVPHGGCAMSPRLVDVILSIVVVSAITHLLSKKLSS